MWGGESVASVELDYCGLTLNSLLTTHHTNFKALLHSVWFSNEVNSSRAWSIIHIEIVFWIKNKSVYVEKNGWRICRWKTKCKVPSPLSILHRITSCPPLLVPPGLHPDPGLDCLHHLSLKECSEVQPLTHLPLHRLMDMLCGLELCVYGFELGVILDI